MINPTVKVTDQSESVVVSRSALSAIMSYAEMSGDLGTIGMRYLKELQSALAAPPHHRTDAIADDAILALIGQNGGV